MASDNHVFACIFDDGEDNDDNEVARVPRRLLKLVIKYSIRVCLSCTLLSAVLFHNWRGYSLILQAFQLPPYVRLWGCTYITLNTTMTITPQNLWLLQHAVYFY